MKLKNKKSGFTLLEIIIVIIIVGVLASLALPRFFATIEFSRSAEALNSMGVLRQSLERCYLSDNGDYTNCTIATLDVEDPANSPGASFSYALSGQSVTGYTLQADRIGDATSWVRLVQGTGGVVRSGSGSYAGIK